MELFKRYLMGYGCGRARVMVPPAELPTKVAEIAALGIGIEDGSESRPLKSVSQLCERVTATLAVDARELTAVRDAEEKIKSATVTAAAINEASAASRLRS